MPPSEVGLYLHIPFCEARCWYCDFATNAGQNDKIDTYLKAVEQEARSCPREQVKTLFIGGGTPTILSPIQIDHLFSILRTSFDFSLLSEATVEANPESTTKERLQAFFMNGINRVSFGLQSTQDRLLQQLGRLHSYGDFLAAFQCAREIGFSNINVDLMFGLPGQSREDWKESIAEIIRLQPNHVSIYALKIEKGTPFDRHGVQVDDDLEADMYLHASEQLKAAGSRHYEISNFSKTGYESRHNLRYWKNEPTRGLGVSAASYMNGKRFKNTNELSDYLVSMSEGKSVIRSTEELDVQQREKENVMLSLRLDEGVRLTQLQNIYLPIFDHFLAKKLAAIESGVYRLLPEGWLLSNQLFENLI